MLKDEYPKEYADCLSYLKQLEQHDMINRKTAMVYDGGYFRYKIAAYTWFSCYAPRMTIDVVWDLVHEVVEEFWKSGTPEPQIV